MGALVRCEYILTGAFDPARVSSVTGFNASKTWRVGDLISTKGERTYKIDGWMCATEYEPCVDIEAPLERLLAQLRPVHGVLMDVVRQYGFEVEVSIAIKVINDEFPATTIACARVAEIADFGAGIDIDIILMDPS